MDPKRKNRTAPWARSLSLFFAMEFMGARAVAEPPQDSSSKEASAKSTAASSGTAAASGEPASTDTGEPSDPAVQEEKAKKEKGAFLRYLDSIFGTPEDPAEPRFILYPVVGFSPETSWEFGVSGLYVYYAANDPRNRLSEVSAFAFVTLEGQYGITVDHALYTDRDEWFFLGEGKAQNFPLLYYGIGPDTPSEPQALVSESSVLFRERILHRLAPSLYFGPEFSFDYLTNVDFEFQEGFAPTRPRGAEGSLNIGMGLGLVYDTRHNVLNVRDGVFSELAFLHSNPSWGSDYSFTIVQSDSRVFFPVNQRDTLAFQLFGQFTFGDVPFNELATLGGESLMRGYYLGRYRDQHFLGGQVEYRFLPFPFAHPFLRRFGATVFASTGGVYSERALPEFKNLVMAGGAGLRFLLFPDKDIYTRGDLAFTKEGAAFYLFIGEAF